MKNTNLGKKVVVDREKCVCCGRCADICWNGAMQMGPDGYPRMGITELTDEWKMCWECQRCMAGCTGALSILGKDPKDMLPRARAFLQIPGNHYISCLVGFGRPEYQFARGVWRSDALKINRITSETTREQL